MRMRKSIDMKLYGGKLPFGSTVFLKELIPISSRLDSCNIGVVAFMFSGLLLFWIRFIVRLALSLVFF